MGIKRAKQFFTASYLSQANAEKKLSKQNYTRDAELSTMNTKVFSHPKKNSVILHRGTANIGDVGTDLLIASGLGSFSQRYLDAKNITKQTEAKYGKPANAYGTSLGGWLAENSGNTGKVNTYNKAVGIADLGKSFNHAKNTDYVTRGDVVSLGNLTQNSNTKYVQNSNLIPNILNAHTTGAIGKNPLRTSYF